MAPRPTMRKPVRTMRKDTRGGTGGGPVTPSIWLWEDGGFILWDDGGAIIIG